MELDLNILAYFDVIRTTVSLRPICKIGVGHVHSMIALALKHRRVHSGKHSGFMEVRLDTFDAFDHVLKLESVVNVISHFTLDDEIGLQYAPFGCDI